MRFLTVVIDLGYRGTQRVAQNYSIALAERGHEVAVLALDSGGNREQTLRQKGIRTFIGGAQLQAALDQACQFEPDIIHIHREGMHNERWGAVLRRLKTPRNRVLETNVFGRVDYSDDAALIDVHLQISRWCLYRWKRWLGKRKQLGIFLPNAVDLSAFPEIGQNQREEARRELALPQSPFICGRIGKWKPSIFTAFADLIQLEPDALLLSVADHPAAQEFSAQLPAHVREKIITIPKLNDDEALVTFYSSLDCLLQIASEGESFGMVLAEAMACGTPVVTASMPHKDNAQVEVVRHGAGGMVAGSESKLTKALLCFYQNRELQIRCSEQSRELITSRYAVSDVVDRIERVARHALSSRDYDDLANRLMEDQGIEVDINQDEIMQSLSDTHGGYTLKDFLLMRLVHNPVLYRCYSFFRHGY